MAEKVTIEVEADVKEAKTKIDEVLEKIDEINDNIKQTEANTKKTETATTGLARGFSTVGVAMKGAGIGIILKIVDQLSNAMMRNQEVADTVSTAFNMIGIVFNKIISTFKTVYDRVTATTDNFDALGRIMSNLMTLAITPLKLAFNGIALVIKEVQLAWEKSWLGKGDQQRIAELTKQITGYKEEIRIAGEEAIKSGKGIIVDFREGIGEISKMGSVVVEEFNNTFKGVTINTIREQAEAVTQATSNLSLLQAKHQRVIVEFEKQAEEQRKIRDDISQSIDDRIEANDKLLEISKEQAKAEIEALEEQKGALATQLDLEVGNKELKAQIFALDTAIIEAKKRETSLDKESAEQRNALNQERIDNLNTLNEVLVDQSERELERIRQEQEQREQLARRTISDKVELEKALTKIEDEASKSRAKIKQEEEQFKYNIVANTLGAISGLIGKESKVGKALAIAQAIINMRSALIGINAPPPIGAGPLFGPIKAVGILASGLANIKAIVSTKVPGDTGGGMPSVAPPPPGDTTVDTTPVAPVFGAIETEPPPVQAFVVESDVSSSQALQNDLDLQATL
ncbi:MAG: hypothetical protein CMH18_01555 [Methylophaga sp.]|uniref:hypothetical protein n=1 Tax=Methylophaga sp. TaxID=2024840 RepID=UPI000C8DDCF9|nr:hypothetical protein [Methylophaga sp.]MAL48425.1 hypothetical protein [Methylophaga sp.]|tara:strand:- start:459 stop:2177 length:1719 start_codon:yes stop_codon:yes gene_type:complete